MVWRYSTVVPAAAPENPSGVTLTPRRTRLTVFTESVFAPRDDLVWTTIALPGERPSAVHATLASNWTPPASPNPSSDPAGGASVVAQVPAGHPPFPGIASPPAGFAALYEYTTAPPYVFVPVMAYSMTMSPSCMRPSPPRSIHAVYFGAPPPVLARRK